jgi:hypothetical protein
MSIRPGPRIAILSARPRCAVLLEPKLAEAGVPLEEVDYLADDHFHFQDLRGLMGAASGHPARFPRTRLLAQRREWDQWDDLHPIHQGFAVPDVKRGVNGSRVILV